VKIHLFLILLFCLSKLQAQPLPIKSGILDLRKVELGDSKIIPLQGEWQFFNQAFYTVEQMRAVKQPLFTLVPGEWNNILWQGKALGGHNFATYQAQILLPKDLASLAINFPTQGTAYRVYANGKLIQEIGKVDKTPALARPKYANYIHIFSEVPDTLILTFHISNHHYSKGGMWHQPLLGKREAIIVWHEWLVAGEFIMLGAVLFMALYHLALFAFRPNYYPPLYFAAVCICTILREGSLGDLLWVKLFPSMPWEVLIKIEYLSLFVGFLMAYWFMHTLFPQDFHRWVIRWLNYIFGFFIGFTLIFPANINSYIIIPFQLTFLLFVLYASFVLIQAIRRRRNGALVFTIGVWCLFAAGINDVLYYNYLISTGAVMTFGLFLYFFSQVLILAKRSANAFHENEKLSEELLATNTNLEQKIRDRTHQLNENVEELNQTNQQIKNTLEELNQQKEYLEELNREKDGLIGVVAHDLRAPFNRQKGLLNLVNLTGELNEEQRSFMAMMEKNCEQGLHLIRDLLVINNAESEVDLPKTEAIDLGNFVQNICQDFAAMAKHKQIELKLQLPDNQIVVEIIPEFLQRILENLISNALKFSHAQKQVFIQLNDLIDHWQIHIQDQGQGIGENELPKLFKKFQKLSARPTAGEDSSGLGLAIVKSLVEKLNGTVQVKSQWGVGTTFSLQFPKAN
jgi:signal transduction histidine kinase